MPDIHIQYQRTRIGDLIIGTHDGVLCLLDFRFRRMRAAVDRRVQTMLRAPYVERDEPLIAETLAQLNAYLDGQRTVFELPIKLAGSPFQHAVWQALMAVPFGATVSYLTLAQTIERPEAMRAVAQANGANALAVIVPCHRVIGADGTLTGYGGGVAIKQRLLQLEAVHGKQPDLFDTP
ncbi:methylated-DNA--[protein]-cysteine S-methyltransferase [Chitinibacteraceae bacterium HSL-7]